MIDYFQNRRDELKDMEGEIVLVYRTDFIRLLGFGEDDRDLYYIGVPLKWEAKEKWYSAVGHIDRMKGMLSDEIYNYLDNIFDINGNKYDGTFKEIRWEGNNDD